MDYGGIMKGTSKWDMIFGKMKKLATAIEHYYGGDMDIDNLEYRWVDDRIKHYEKRNRLLNKQEMRIANLYWRKYNV
jgi:hypothetical protein